MERLTKRDSKGRAYFDNDGVLLRGANGVFRQKKDMTAHYIHDRFVALDKTLDRLAAYEDIGLEPKEIKNFLKCWCAAAERGGFTPPPNDPLTLEELREMDGEPVWVYFPKCPEASGWMLISAARHCVYDGLLGDCDFDNCGQTWLAYRCKPEEIQT